MSEALAVAVDAAFPDLPGGMTRDEAESRIAYAIDAYLCECGLRALTVGEYERRKGKQLQYEES